MLSYTLKLPDSHLPRTLLRYFCYPVEQTVCPASVGYAVKNFAPRISVGIGLFRSYGSTRKVIYLCRMPHALDSCKVKLKYGIVGESNLTAKVLVHSHLKLLVTIGNGENEETPLKKVYHGNKGRVPWNKGRRHSEALAETRARIRQNTKEALKDPKVRKKMADAPRSLSIQTKARIGNSVNNLWAKRLIWKRPREKFLQSWAGSIAEAARRGGSDQEELEWNTYAILRKEMSLLLKQRDAEVKAKEVARRRAERAADADAKKVELAELEKMKLKERLIRIHRKISRIIRVSSQHQRPWEHFDMELVTEERLQNQISLADQIHVTKNRRAEQTLDSC